MNEYGVLSRLMKLMMMMMMVVMAMRGGDLLVRTGGGCVLCSFFG